MSSIETAEPSAGSGIETAEPSAGSGTETAEPSVESLTKTPQQRSLRHRLKLFYLNYTGLLYFLVFEVILVGAALVLGVLGTGSTTVGLRTQTDLTTAWSGVAGALAIMYGVLLGPPLLVYYAWDFIDRYR